MALIKVLQRVGVKLFLIRLRVEDILAMYVFDFLILAVLCRMYLNLWKVLAMHITHKKICIGVPARCSRDA